MRPDKTGRTPIEQGKSMITTEQTRETVNRLDSIVENARRSSIANITTLVEQILKAHRQISLFISENRRFLSKGNISPMEFGEGEELGRNFNRQWLASGRSVLPMLETFPEVSESSSVLALRRLIGEVDQELREIDFHQKSMDAFLEKHPMPEAWLAPDFAADEHQGGTDVRDYLAALPR